MTPANNPICMFCKHYQYETEYRRCKAFKGKIPDSIWLDGGKHQKPLSSQDNDVVFTSIEEEK